MKFLLQIFLLFIIWFTNTVNATPVFTRVACPSCQLLVSKAENHKQESEVKIGVSNFARSNISENEFSQKAVLWESSVLENRAREGNVNVVSGAGSVFKVGDNIIGKVVQKVKPGTNGKIAVVGRQMNNHVNDVAAHLKNNQGFQVEILSDNYLNRTFNIDGVEWSVNSAWDDMVLNPAYDYMKDPITGHITIEYIEQIPMYKLNKQWIEQIQSEGFTIIDIGYPQGLPSESLFYNMEINTINW